MSPERGLVAFCVPRIISIFAFKGFVNYPAGSLEKNVWAAQYHETGEEQLGMVAGAIWGLHPSLPTN